MEKLFICYISGGLELLGIEKFNLGGLQVLKDIKAIEIKSDDDKVAKGCEILNTGLAMAISDDEVELEKKLAIAKIVNDTNLPVEKVPFICYEIRKKALLLMLQSAEPEINKQAVKAWDNFFEIAARTAAANVPPEIKGEIEKVKFLFNQFPDIPKAGLSYLRYCYKDGKLPPEEEWLPDILDFSDAYKGNIDLTTEVLACLL